MKTSLVEKQKVYFILGVIGLSLFLFGYFSLFQTSLAYKYDYQYTTIKYLMLVYLAIYCIAVKKNPYNILQPLHVYTAFHFCIFFLTPLVLVNVGKAKCVGVEVMNSAVYATVLVILGYLAYVIGYTKYKIVTRIKPITLNMTVEQRRKILNMSYFVFTFLVLVNMGLLVYSGFGIKFLFTLGSGSSNVVGIPDNVLFLINISYLMLVPWLFILFFSNSLILKLICSYILFVIFFAYGWRFIIYIIALSACVVYYRSSNKTPSLKHMMIIGIMLLLISVFMGSVRNSIRSGSSAEFDGFSNDNIAFTLESNFNIYQPYYAIIDKYPSRYDYWYGQALFVYPVIMWVPRLVWPDKPRGAEYPLTISMKKAVGADVLDKAAMSAPNITEYYLDFGPLGIIFFSYILGLISKRLFQFYYEANVFNIIKYALFLGFLIQLINRGYIAQLLTLLIFLYVPLLFYKRYFKLKA